MSFMTVMILEIGLKKDLKFPDRKNEMTKKFCRPTESIFLSHVKVPTQKLLQPNPIADHVRFGRIWSDMVGFGRIFNLDKFGRVWSDLVRFGRIWSYLVGFGRICRI